MKLASHNSATGERPRNLWARWFRWIAQCQSKTILEQYMAGVRLFDIRVRYEGTVLRCCHGLATYDKTLYGICDQLLGKTDVWLMVTYEGFLDEKDYERFLVDVRCETQVHNLNLGHVSVKLPEWNIIEPNSKTPAYVSNYTKMTGWRILWPFPKFWWKRRHVDITESRNNEMTTDKEAALSMEDFV